MSNIEKIRQEIERLKKILEESTYYLDNSQQALGYSFALDDFSAFIDSLPDEPVDYAEELKKCKDNPLYFYDKYVKVKQEQPEVNLEKFTEKMNDWKARYNHPDNIPIKATIAFTARMFYQYPNVARQWYDSLPKATMD